MKLLVSILTIGTICILAGILGFLMGTLGYWFSIPVLVILLYLNYKDYIEKRKKKKEEIKKKEEFGNFLNMMSQEMEKRNETTKKD